MSNTAVNQQSNGRESIDVIHQSTKEREESARESTKKVNALLSSRKSLVESLQNLRSTRQKRIASLKARRQEKQALYAELASISQEMHPLLMQTRDAAKNTPHMRSLVNERERLEWVLQTEATSAAKEKAIATQIRAIERQMPALQAMQHARNALAELRRKREGVIAQLQKVKDSLHQESAAFDELQKTISAQSAKVTSLDEEISQQSREVDAQWNAHREAREQLRQVQRIQREQEEKERHAQAQVKAQAIEQKKTALREKAAVIRSDLASGKTISWEDMQVLAEVEDSP